MSSPGSPDAGLLVLLDLAAGDAPPEHAGGGQAGGLRFVPGDSVARARVGSAMGGLGWGYRDGGLLTSDDVVGLAGPTVDLLRRCGVFAEPTGGIRRSMVPTPEGSTFARAALQTWR